MENEKLTNYSTSCILNCVNLQPVDVDFVNQTKLQMNEQYTRKFEENGC